MKIDTYVCGIPAVIHVTSWGSPGNPRADSDWDFHGEPPEYEICDRRGRPAPWLERKLTPKDWNKLNREVDNEIKESCYAD